MELACSNVMQYRENNPKVCEIPFNSTNKYHVSLNLFTYICVHIVAKYDDFNFNIMTN